MFSFVAKLVALRDTLKLLASGFPDVVTDVETVFSDIEGFILTKSWWNVSAINKVVADGEALYVDFVKDYTGSADQIKAHIADLRARFA